METLRGPRTGRGWADVVRDYTAGVRSRDLERLFRQDTADAFRVLTRDQPRTPTDRKGIKGALHRAGTVFLGLSFALSPARRLVFALALLFALVGACDIEVATQGGHLVVDLTSPFLYASIGLLVLLLALELVDRVQVRDELEVAQELQRGLLPTAAPEVPGWQFAHSYRTAREIGGDYYDFLRTGDGRLALVVADASGHGLAAGLLMVIAHSVLRLAVSLDPRPAAVASLVNRVLVGTGGPRAFMTLFYGLLDPESGTLSFVGAGHPFPLLRRADGRLEELGEGGLPLGLRDGLTLREQTIRIDPGDLLVLYSDGLPEGFHPGRGRAFGFDALRQLAAAGGSPRRAHDRVLAAFDAYMAGEPAGDDVSLVVVGREPRTAAPRV